MNSAVNSRPNGVVLPQSQLSPGTGVPQTLTGFAEAKSYGVEYVDEAGNKHVTVLMRIGDQWYLPPNGENYASTLRQLNKDTWLAKLLTDRFNNSITASLPKEDAVDILGK